MLGTNQSPIVRYALSVLVFAAVVAVTSAVRRLDLAVNLSLLVVAGLAVAAWYLGRGPGLLLLGLLWVLALASTPSDPNVSPSSFWLSQISVVGAFAFIVIMVSGRRNYERNLRRQSELFRTTLASIDDAVVTTDKDGIVTFANPSAEQMLGVDANEAKGKSLKEIFLPVSEIDQIPASNVFDRVRSERETIHIDDHVISLNGIDKPVPVAAKISPIMDEEKGFLGAVTVIEDISLRREAESTREQSEERLQQAQKLEAIGTLTGGVAHDFNNLLTAILGYSQLLITKVGSSDPIHRGLTEIEKAGTRGAELTRKLLAFSRRQQLERRIINLNDSIAEVLGLLDRLIGVNIKISFNADESIQPVFADASQIEQVIMNLCLNARDAMPDGGSIKIETSNVNLDEVYCRQFADLRPGKFVQISVSDDGIGMDKETSSRIFEPFFTTKSAQNGTGLGLSMAYGIINQHGGRIIFYSEPGSGTSFRIVLPAVESDFETRSDELSPAVARGTETILVADDEESLRNLSYDVLTALGYNVVLAQNGREAVEMFTKLKGEIDLLLFDVTMPELGGIEAFRQIQAIAERPVSLIFMSGYNTELLQTDDLHRSATPDGQQVHLIQKPFTLAKIAGLVREVLDGQTDAQT